MTRFIEHLVEPHRLLLCWQAHESKKRSRFHIGQLVKQGGLVLLQYSDDDEMAQAKAAGFRGYPAFPLKQLLHSHQVMEAFTRRLPPRNRRDFAHYLELRALPENAEISDFALLGYTGAKLPDDGFELVHPFDAPPPVFEVLIEVAGFRHEAEVVVEALQTGDSIQFVEEPNNCADPKAIRMEHKGQKLGYVPRGHLAMLHRMLSEGANLAGEIFRINGTSARPLVYVLTQITLTENVTMQNNLLRQQA
ncbi:MAG: hypothetical protein IBX50_18495 [Marinospirillum sp.]|uniref:HIRAN domain-containing protein n=1 Tax=Marinospirillum sp. TaxID=2183934 RepID=UPI0019FC80EC|nr:HIRAN domain-containing protein [Marinospirillum sp.]MBE0508677.1 hypothetical protein [Marinospirillum sp.]